MAAGAEVAAEGAAVASEEIAETGVMGIVRKIGTKIVSKASEVMSRDLLTDLKTVNTKHPLKISPNFWTFADPNISRDSKLR